MNLMGILVFVLTAVLMYLYHKLFTVIYTNPIYGILREIVICFGLSIVILAIICQIFGIDPSPKKSEANQPPAQESSYSQSPSSQQGSSSKQGLLPSQEPPIKSFYGNFYNTILLEGGIYETFLIITPSELSDDCIHFWGMGVPVGMNYVQAFDEDIPMPEGNTFTYSNDYYGTLLTITLHPEDHTLDIVQEVTDADEPTPYTGSYVDSDVWDGLIDERRAAIQRLQDLAQPNQWINDYSGEYILETFAEGIEGAPYVRFELIANDNNSGTFKFSFSEYYDRNTVSIDEAITAEHIYQIPYPLGNREDHHIEYETDDGLISFDVLDDKADGRHVIQVTACPFLGSTGVFVSGAELIDRHLGQYEKLLIWPGDYVWSSGGADGSKSISISQVSDQFLSIEMVHNYADGHQETYHADAEIDAYGNGSYYALSVGEKWIDFKLQEDPETGEKVVRVEQTGINPSIDPEFVGTYVRGS